jgi:hypothetical protein
MLQNRNGGGEDVSVQQLQTLQNNPSEIATHIFQTPSLQFCIPLGLDVHSSRYKATVAKITTSHSTLLTPVFIKLWSAAVRGSAHTVSEGKALQNCIDIKRITNTHIHVCAVTAFTG